MRCNDGEVTREADERWREGGRTKRHVTYLSCLEGWRRGRHGNTKSSLKYVCVLACVLSRVCVLVLSTCFFFTCERDSESLRLVGMISFCP